MFGVNTYPGGVQVNRNHPLNQGKVAWFNLQPNFLRYPVPDANNVWDLMSQYQGSLVNGASKANNPKGNSAPGPWALSLVKASSQDVSISQSKPFQIQSQTFACWLYLNTLVSTDIPGLLATSSDTSTNGSCWGINLSNFSTPVFSFFYFDTAVQIYSDTTNITTGTWTHLAGTWNQAAGTVKFWINGSLSSTVATTTGTIAYSSTPVLLGSAVNGAFIDGYMNDVQLWNRVLSAGVAQEIQQLYQYSKNAYVGSGMIMRSSPLGQSPTPFVYVPWDLPHSPQHQSVIAM